MLVTIFLANLLSRLLIVGIAAYFAFRLLKAWVEALSLVACGMLLTIALMHLVPEAIETGIPTSDVVFTFLGAFLFFYAVDFYLSYLTPHTHALPKAYPLPALLGGGVRYRVEVCSVKPIRATPVLVGAALHNTIDGVLVAMAFLTDTKTGCAITLAIVLHEIPQCIGELAILGRLGLEIKKAVLWCFLAALAAPLGGLGGVYLLESMKSFMPYAMLVSAASFLFVVLIVLLPEFGAHGEENPRYVQKAAFFLLGAFFSFLYLTFFHF